MYLTQLNKLSLNKKSSMLCCLDNYIAYVLAA